MDFSHSETQAELAGLARKILDERDTPGQQWADLATAGVLAAGLPESLGGAGLGFLEQCSVLAEAGRAAAPVPYLASVVLGAGAIAAFGSADQQRRWAIPAGEGSVVLTAALEEEDCWIRPRRRAGGAGWRGLDAVGRENGGSRAPVGRPVLVPATAAASTSAPGGVMVFLVEPSDAGVGVAPQSLTDAAPSGRLVLDGVAVDDSRILGAPGQGAQVVSWLAARATVGLCAVQAGVAEQALELTARYARTREQFGRPIGSFQAVAQRLADAYIDVKAIWLTMWQAAWLLDGYHGDAVQSSDAVQPDAGDVAAAVATAKFWAADAGHRVAHTAVHVHGGTGIDMSHPAHRYFLAAKQAEFTLGGATQQLVRLGDILAGTAPAP